MTGSTKATRVVEAVSAATLRLNMSHVVGIICYVRSIESGQSPANTAIAIVAVVNILAQFFKILPLEPTGTWLRPSLADGGAIHEIAAWVKREKLSTAFSSAGEGIRSSMSNFFLALIYITASTRSGDGEVRSGPSPSLISLARDTGSKPARSTILEDSPGVNTIFTRLAYPVVILQETRTCAKEKTESLNGCWIARDDVVQLLGP